MFYKRAREIHNFRLPRWRELPEEEVLRGTMLQYIEEHLSPLFPDRVIITGTMVQNYIKWGLAPRPVNRRYGRIHMVHFIVLSVLKEIISTQYVHTGISLLTRLMNTELAYDSFCDRIEDSMQRVTAFLLKPIPETEPLEFRGLNVPLKKLNLAFICESLAFKLLAEMFIDQQGLMGSLVLDKEAVDWELEINNINKKESK
ncbi:MAG TPA: DUF1836 domain-containing protein [Bacillota bacterium]|nr:DUF1836 domain-containing protein [Bacillota bacterium]